MRSNETQEDADTSPLSHSVPGWPPRPTIAATLCLLLLLASASAPSAHAAEPSELKFTGGADLQALLDNAPAGAVVVCEQTEPLVVAKTLRIARPMTLRGLKARLPEKLGKTVLLVVEAPGVSLADLELRGNYDSVSQDDRAPLIHVKAGSFRVERCRFFDGSKDGIMVTPDDGAGDIVGGLIRDIEGNRMGRDLVSLSGGCGGQRIRSVTVENVRLKNGFFRGAVEVSDGADSVTVRHVRAEDAVYAVDVQDHGAKQPGKPAPSAPNTNITIEDVTAVNCKHVLRTANNPLGHSNLTIRDLTATDCREPLVISNTVHVRVRNLAISSQPEATTPRVTLRKCDDVVLENVTVAGLKQGVDAVANKKSTNVKIEGLKHEAAPTTPSSNEASWKINTPIVTYWAGPTLTDAVAQQMAEGGWNLVWCGEKELDIAQRHGLRAQLQDGLLSPATLDKSEERAKLDALIARVRSHPALYSYFITDEPGAAAFPALGKLVAYLRERDPAHLAYINLFPTYASNEQLGTKGDKIAAYAEHLRQYMDVVKPSLVSYDHYQFAVGGDNPDYFLNLAMIRRTALEARVPFLNIVQACTWTPSMRVPGPDELRYLLHTTLAYGGQGMSYYVYCHPGHTGAIALADGTPTPLYHALKSANRQFAAIAKELQPLRSLAVYHAGMAPPGSEPLPPDAPFRFDPPVAPLAYSPPEHVRGFLLGYFGTDDKPTHAMVVNLDYKTEATVVLTGPGTLEAFDATAGTWSSAGGPRLELRLPPGGGKLVRVTK
ncbi:MAG: right-handed parallel beta-helix repeat-containing protein [Pirellulales bacterium]